MTWLRHLWARLVGTPEDLHAKLLAELERRPAPAPPPPWYGSRTLDMSQIVANTLTSDHIVANTLTSGRISGGERLWHLP